MFFGLLWVCCFWPCFGCDVGVVVDGWGWFLFGWGVWCCCLLLVVVGACGFLGVCWLPGARGLLLAASVLAEGVWWGWMARLCDVVLGFWLFGLRVFGA